jgi:hypothetical protein
MQRCPPEVLRNILKRILPAKHVQLSALNYEEQDRLERAKATLNAVSLVCRLMTRPAQELLFQTIIIRPDQDWDQPMGQRHSLAELIDHNPALANYTRRLQILNRSYLPVHHWPFGDPVGCGLLARFHKILHIELFGLNLESIDDVSCISSLSSLGPVESLAFDLCKFHSPLHLSVLVECFRSSLMTLFLSRISLEAFYFPTEEVSPVPRSWKISMLDLWLGDKRGVFDWIAQHNMGESVVKLHVSGSYLEELSKLSALVSSTRCSSVQTLMIAIHDVSSLEGMRQTHV